MWVLKTHKAVIVVQNEHFLSSWGKTIKVGQLSKV